MTQKRVFISLDMEGITGVIDGSQTGGDPVEYAYYRKQMALDLNAAIEGAIEAGAKEIAVSDAHGGMRNVQPEDVHEEAILIRGSPKPWSMMAGIDKGYDAAFYVGYHAMQGTENGVLAHTISGNVVDAVFVNGRETGEFGLNAAIAGWHGVPSVFISGDEAVCSEAASFVANVNTAVIKWALGRVSAKCLHPTKARRIIKDAAKASLSNLSKISPYYVNEPVEVKIRWVTVTMADAVAFLPFADRVDGKTTSMMFEDYLQAFRGIRTSIQVASTTVR